MVTASAATSQDVRGDSLREVVEAALDSEDVTPLVRLVFDAQLSAASAAPSNGGRAPVAEENGGDENGNAAHPPAFAKEDPAEAVMLMLQQVADEQTAEIGQICRANADEIARSVAELGSMSGYAGALRERVMENDMALQAAGGAFLGRLDELQELASMQGAVRNSRQAVALAVKLLQMTAAAAHYIMDNKLYKAFRLLERIRTQHLLAPQQHDSLRMGRTHDGKENKAGKKGRSSLPVTAHSLGKLQPFLAARVDELMAAIEARAIADFNNWLVSVRAEARNIGLRALRRAALERAQEEALLAERKALTTQLSTQPDARLAAAMVAKAIPASSGAAGQAPPAVLATVSALDPAAHPAAVRLISEAKQGETSQDLLAGVDMSLLHRCIQIHQCLGRVPQFLQYYARNRRLQLTSDLAPPANFLENHQTYICQITGFFVVEERVARASEGGGALGAGVDAGWEAALAALKVALEAAWEAAPDARTVLQLKDLMLLVCSALGGCGYHVVPIQEVLVNGRTRYHELLCNALVPRIAQVAKTELMTPLQVAKAAQAEELTEELGLPLSITTTPAVTPPCEAPFTPAVPDLLRLARGFVAESVAYLAGLVSPGEVVPAARQQRDRMLGRLVAGHLQRGVDTFSLSAPSALRRAMQHVADIVALAAGLPALDDYTTARARGNSAKEAKAIVAKAAAARNAAAKEPGRQLAARPAPAPREPLPPAKYPLPRSPSFTASGAVGTLGALTALRQAAERVVVRVMAGQAGTILAQARALPWLPDQPPRATAAHSPYLEELLMYLREAMALGVRMMPAESCEAVARAMLAYCGDALMALLAEDAIPAFNLYALFRLHTDVAALADYADKLRIPGAAEGLAEVQQFLDLVVTNRLEEVVDPAARARAAPALDLRRLARVLDKYCEVGDKASFTGHHTFTRSKQPASFLKKQTVEKVVRQLKALLKESELQQAPAAP